jgi:hypothetical protein
MSSPHKTAEQIAAELAALQAIKPSLPAESDCGDDNLAAIDAQISVLRDRLTLNEVYEAYQGCTYTLHRALRAHFWAAGKLAPLAYSPAKMWASTLTADDQQPPPAPAAADAMVQLIRAKGADVAPRVTVEDVEANIVDEVYFTAEQGYQAAMRAKHPDLAEMGNGFPYGSLGLLTFCVMLLRNGFTVTGESACASPENFNADIGRQVARANAINKIWPLMGYELRSRLAGYSAGRAAQLHHGGGNDALKALTR